MSRLVIPRIECVETKDNFGRFTAEPLEKGFGVTLGNALRRILLSYLPGATVTQVRIEGIRHEFTVIPHAKEDVTEFLLNVKALRLKSLSNQPGKLILDIQGEGPVRAADIKPSADFEIANPELCLITLDSPEAKLYIEFDVELGEGYRTAESPDNMPVGTIPVDAIFTPMRKVNFTIEPIHVGQETSRERLVLEVWTDGSVMPKAAISYAADIFMEHLEFFVIEREEEVQESAEAAPAEPEEDATLNNNLLKSVDELELSVRAHNCLKNAEIKSLADLVQRTEYEMLRTKNFGRKSLNEIKEILGSMGLNFGMRIDPTALEKLKEEAE